MKDLRLIATTFYGLEKILADELANLGAKDIRIANRAVYFTGDKGFIYKANFNLHTALRVLKQIGVFTNIYKPSQLYNAVYSVDWSDIFHINQTFRIDVTGQTKFFDNTRFTALKAKDAIVDQFRNKYGKRPDVSVKSAAIRIILHFQNQNLHLLLDSSGESLHKRGYRTLTNKAPLNEVLAAGIVGLSGWDGQTGLLDPMCGSGTILIEAVMKAMRIPAGINRKHFSFENWPDFDDDLFTTIKNAGIDKIRDLPAHIKVTGFDKAPSAIEKARQNIINANLDDYIKIKHADFFKTYGGKNELTLLFNPPYNERLSIDVKEFYKKTGDTLKFNYPGNTAWLLAGNLQAIKSIGLRPEQKIKLFNGKIEAALIQYKLYSGSKKSSSVYSGSV
jgi:putative N6-adenine-specific DNA methylase